MKHVQFIRDIASNANLFVGLDGEITVDTTARELRLHDGTTPGGYGVARKDLANVSAASSTNAGKMTAAQVIVLENSMQRPLTWTTGRLTKFDASGNPVDSAVTATEAQLNYLSGVTAGTRTASKAVVVDGSGFIDALGITTVNITNLQIGGVSVTATATEINYTDVTTPGTAQASKAVVTNASKNIQSLGAVGIGSLNWGWNGTTGAVDIGTAGGLVSYADNTVELRENNYYGLSGHTYKNNGAASLLQLTSAGGIIFYTAAAGTAGAAAALTNRFAIDVSGTTTINGNTVWHAGNDGHLSTLDADTVDGVHGASFARVDAATNFTTAPTINSNAIYIVGGTDVAIADGGTGASTVNGARENLGIYHGRVDGTGASIRLPSGWSVARNAAGDYTVTHNLGTANYTVVPGRINGSEAAAGALIYVWDQTTTTFRVYTFDGTATAADRDFSFTLTKD